MERRTTDRRQGDRRSAAQKDRARAANQVIAALASRGQRLLWSDAHDRTSALGLDKHGQVWFIDGHTGIKLYPFGLNHWPGFTGGAAMQILVAALADFIHSGVPLVADHITPEAWGYAAADADAIRNAVFQTGAVTAPADFIPFGD